MSEHSADNDAAKRDELVKGVRMAIVSWNTLGPRKVGEDVSEFIADWLIVNRVIPPVVPIVHAPSCGWTTGPVCTCGADPERMEDQ